MTPQDYGRAGGIASGAARVADAVEAIHAEIAGLSDLQAKLVLRMLLRAKDTAYQRGYRAGERRRAQ